MTTIESISSLSQYPISQTLIERTFIVRNVSLVDDFSAEIESSDNYQLALADVYMYLHNAPDLREQDIYITNNDRNNYLNMANAIYKQLNDSKFSGGSYGYNGESFS